MTCQKCESTAVVEEEVCAGVCAPHCIICGKWYHTPDEPPLTDNHQANRAAKLKAWGERQDAAGMCRNCCEPVVEGHKYCADHLEFHQRTCTENQQKGAA